MKNIFDKKELAENFAIDYFSKTATSMSSIYVAVDDQGRCLRVQSLTSQSIQGEDVFKVKYIADHEEKKALAELL